MDRYPAIITPFNRDVYFGISQAFRFDYVVVIGPATRASLKADPDSYWTYIHHSHHSGSSL